jgi:hypothetical protein
VSDVHMITLEPETLFIFKMFKEKRTKSGYDS